MIAILDNIRSAYNVGSIIRTCDSLGVESLYLCGITPGPDNKKVKKTSLGAEKSVQIEEYESLTQAITKAKSIGYRICSLEITSSSIPIKNFKKTSKIALILGNEVSGVSEEGLLLSSEVIHIPMRGSKESLNVSVAFGIVAYQILNS